MSIHNNSPVLSGHNMSLTFFALFGLLAYANAGVPYAFDPRIVNGEDVKPGEIPFQASLQLKGSSFHFCGGSVLTENYIITAAHCVEGQYASNIEIVIGTVDLGNRVSVHQAAQIIMHEKYNPSDSWKNDIALIKVKTPIVEHKQISFVTLPKPGEAVKPGDVAIVSGWGRLWQGGPTSNQLKRAHLYITEQQRCAKIYKTVYQNIHDTHICANDPSVETGACNGDSGGPLTVNGKLVGLVSWSLGCALTDYPTVYTRVTEYLDWIQEHIA